MNIQPLLDALDLQTDAARTLADDLRAHIDDLQTRLREAETHLEHLAITRKTVSPASPTGSRPSLRTCPSTRTTPASSPPSTTRPDRDEPRTSAKPSATNCSRRTSKAPAPS